MALTFDPATMSTGIDSVDAQHKVLIADLNTLLEAMAAGQGSARLDSVLAKLETYAATHFKHEEACMAKYACPSAAANIGAHKKFVETFVGIRNEVRAKGPSAALTLRAKSELVDWLGNHVNRVDTTLLPCVR